MQSTRAKILELLRRRREATIEDLTRELELAPATVRRHLDVLQRDGQVTTRSVRRPTGRPHFVFTLTADAPDAAPSHYIRVTSRLIEELVRLEPEQTRGRDGQDRTRLVFDRFTHKLARQCRSAISGDCLEERLDQALAQLAAEGMLFEVIENEGSLLVRGEGCPCRRMSGNLGQCNHDLVLLAAVLDAEVIPVTSGGVYDARAYLVRERKPRLL